LFGAESQADGPNFFCPPMASRSDAELDATRTDSLRRCPTLQRRAASDLSFPARYRWLDRMLGSTPRGCTGQRARGFDEFYKRVERGEAVVRVLVVLPNNPRRCSATRSSRIVNAQQRQRRTAELLDYAIDSRDRRTGNAPGPYGSRLFGMFPGTFRNVPYHFKGPEYNDYESRDLYE